MYYKKTRAGTPSTKFPTCIISCCHDILYILFNFLFVFYKYNFICLSYLWTLCSSSHQITNRFIEPFPFLLVLVDSDPYFLFLPPLSLPKWFVRSTLPSVKFPQTLRRNLCLSLITIQHHYHEIPPALGSNLVSSIFGFTLPSGPKYLPFQGFTYFGQSGKVNILNIARVDLSNYGANSYSQ